MSTHGEKSKRFYAGQKEDVFPETRPTLFSKALPTGQAFRPLLSSISGHQVAPESGKRNRA